MGSRRHKRTSLQTQVRIFGTDARGNPYSRVAETVDVSPCGVRLSGVYVDLRPGDEVDLRTEDGHGHFRVVWQGKVGTPHAGEVALQSTDANAPLWSTEDPEWVDTFDEASRSPERRFHRRFECDLPACVTAEGEPDSVVGRCVDVSFGGCYLTTKARLEPDTRVSVSISSPAGPPLCASGYVRSVHPHFGTGIRFTCVQEPRVLAALLDSLRKGGSNVARSTVRVPAKTPDSPAPLGKTILVVDDSLAIRGVATHHLRHHGYSVVAAKDGEEALRLAYSEHPDLILLDLMLPKLSGLAVLRHLKSNPETQHIPVMVISSLPEDNDARMLAEGACGYVGKSSMAPEKLPQLVDRTFRHLLAQAARQR